MSDHDIPEAVAAAGQVGQPLCVITGVSEYTKLNWFISLVRWTYQNPSIVG